LKTRSLDLFLNIAIALMVALALNSLLMRDLQMNYFEREVQMEGKSINA
jgi:hypothetical protein